MDYRIKLSTFGELDNFDSYLEWLNDPAVFKFLEADSKKSSVKEIQDYINLQNKEGSIFLPVLYISNNAHIGNLKIYNFRNENNLKLCTYSRVIGDRSYWGMGLGYELGFLALDYCFNILNIDRVEAACHSSNLAAIKSNLRLGFIESHKNLKYIKKEDKEIEIINFKIDKSSFRKI